MIFLAIIINTIENFHLLVYQTCSLNQNEMVIIVAAAVMVVVV